MEPHVVVAVQQTSGGPAEETDVEFVVAEAALSSALVKDDREDQRKQLAVVVDKVVWEGHACLEIELKKELQGERRHLPKSWSSGERTEAVNEAARGRPPQSAQHAR